VGGNNVGGGTTYSSVEALTINGNAGNDTVDQNSTTNAPLTFNGGLNAGSVDTLNINGGSYTFNADANVGTLAMNLTVASGASTTFNTNQHLNSLVLNGTGLLTSATPGLALRTAALSIGAAGTLDLTRGYMIVDYTASSPLTTIQTYVKNGYAAGAWTGTASSIRSSTAAADGTHLTGVGYAEASVVLTPSGGTFSSQSVDGTTVLVTYTYYGDANLNRTVELNDFSAFAASFNTSSSLWSSGDFNFNGSIELNDFSALAANFNKTLPA
jgi:hypothetical protein